VVPGDVYDGQIGEVRANPANRFDADVNIARENHRVNVEPRRLEVGEFKMDIRINR
jgi:hypothetical protein